MVMSEQHTPGPWMEMGAEPWSVDNEYSGSVSYVGIGPASNGERHVALVVWDGHYADLEYDANARLIAAAPELLGALEAVSVIRPSNWDDDEDPDQVAAWRMLDAAIAKARAAA